MEDVRLQIFFLVILNRLNWINNPLESGILSLLSLILTSHMPQTGLQLLLYIINKHDHWILQFIFPADGGCKASDLILKKLSKKSLKKCQKNSSKNSSKKLGTSKNTEQQRSMGTILATPISVLRNPTRLKGEGELKKN